MVRLARIINHLDMNNIVREALMLRGKEITLGEINAQLVHIPREYVDQAEVILSNLGF